MISKLKDLVSKFKKKEEPVKKKKKKKNQFHFSTDLDNFYNQRRMRIAEVLEGFQQQIDAVKSKSSAGIAMDSADSYGYLKSTNSYNILNDAIFGWYFSQTFIGYQACAILAQHWLINKCCRMPAEDAIRNGYEITINDGTEVNPKIMDAIKELDKEYKINKNLEELIYYGRMFGIRVAMYVVESDDPDFYKNPFNIDGVTEGSYKGISQIDPFWITPILDSEAQSNPAAINFYEPTWYLINGKLVHRSHLVIYIPKPVADILKPMYLYGGMPYPQLVYERVYAAERTANEAPLLSMTKRTDVLKTDATKVLANQSQFEQRMSQYSYFRDNFGTKIIGEDEEMQRLDTALSDLDNVIMTQYQLSCAQSEAPSTRMLGTSPKGFNSNGEYEEANYHESLKTTQTQGMTPLAEGHYLRLIKSEIAPKYGIEDLKVHICWNPLDEMTAEELANVNKLKADTGLVLTQSGAINGQDERDRIIKEKGSGYNGIIDEDAPEPDPMEEQNNETEEENAEQSATV